MPLLSKLLPAGSLWKKLLPLLLALTVAATCYRAGYLNRDGRAKTEMAAVAAAHQLAQLEAERAYSAKLAEVAAERQKWVDFAQSQSVKLAEANRRLDTKTTHIKQEIPHAIARDKSTGGCYSGLGADSLRLYRQAFGYSAD
jgi:hypothetical protein|nr:MAG TPA: hypothetical protein [Caudoviricetes sp.]